MDIGSRIFGAICTGIAGILSYLCAKNCIELFFYRLIGTLTQWEMCLTGLFFFGTFVFGFLALVFGWVTISGD